MSTQGLLLVITSALLTVAANLMLRASVLHAGGLSLTAGVFRQLADLARQPLFVTGVFLYGLAALVWFQVLSVEKLSTSYPLLVSLTFVMVTLGAMVFFKEQVSAGKLFGVALCLAGVFVVARA
jgi:multidrug transporter EmrE-like cation transporter